MAGKNARADEPRGKSTRGRADSTALQPTGLLCELMEHPERTVILNPRPLFGWIVNDQAPDAFQIGMQILVASSLEALARDEGDLWDSGVPNLHTSWSFQGDSINVRYAGKPLAPHATYHWKVRTWTGTNNPSVWSEPQTFRTGELADHHATPRYPLETTPVEPVKVVTHESGTVFADFGRAAFGTVQLELRSSEQCTAQVRLGEVLAGPYAIEPTPGGSRRYRTLDLRLEKGRHTYRPEIPADARNTGKAAIRMPEETGEVMPFRYCEVVGAPGPVTREGIRQLAVSYPFDEGAARFASSNRVLDDVWELCKYSMKATSFCGIYVDGDRERIPYEGDAYINQLGHYCCDREFTLARATHEYLLEYPTWPTEWAMHSVLMAWVDYLHTGDSSSFEAFYDELAAKTLIELEREDGLISAPAESANAELLARLCMDNERYIFDRKLVDIVDWPQGERDGHVLVPVNTVVNAYHYGSLVLMARMAQAVGKTADAKRMGEAAAKVRRAVNEKLFDNRSGIYVDGEGTTHSSLHSNMFPLAFDLVPPDRVATVATFVKSRGMACSVYGSHHLLEALYRAGEADYALALLTSTAERGWAHMIYDVGSTISLEAWDDRFKPNQDWNHAWGAAPASAIPRWLMGVRPLAPGFGEMLIRPQPGSLTFAEMTLPTIRGAVQVRFEHRPGESLHLEVELPGNTKARVGLPRFGRTDSELSVDGRRVCGIPEGETVYVEGVGSGLHSLDR